MTRVSDDEREDHAMLKLDECPVKGEKEPVRDFASPKCFPSGAFSTMTPV
jgi:hypothetical protein